MAAPHSTTVDRVTTRGSTVHLDVLLPEPWGGSADEILWLQEKLNLYLTFVVEGQLLQRFPEARNRDVVIRIDAVMPLDDSTALFLDKAREKLMQFDVGLAVEPRTS